MITSIDAKVNLKYYRNMQKNKLTYHITTFGCQMNESDSQRMAAILKSIGLTEAQNEESAHIVLVNACSVRQTAIDRIWGKMHKYNKLKKKNNGLPYTVLTGCVLPADRPKFIDTFDLFFPMKDLPELPGKIEQLISQKKEYKKREKKNYKKFIPLGVQQLLADKQISYEKNPPLARGRTKEGVNKPLTPNSQIPTADEHYLKIKPQYSNSFSAFVPVMTGCNAFCTYCAVPYTRGREVSRKPQEILEEVLGLIKKEYKEITLLGQIVNKYMTPLDDELEQYIEKTLNTHGIQPDTVPELQDADYRTHKLFKFHHLLGFVGALPGDFWLRFTSSHPKWFSDELIDTIARTNKIPQHIHLPVQAGADSTLRRMLRPYTVDEYKKIITKIRTALPEAALTTDCIVGFCGETEQEFQQTKDLFTWAQYDMAFIGQYSTRPGTKADLTMEDDVPHDDKERRDRELTDILRSTSEGHNKKLADKKVTVLVDSIKKRKGTTYFHGRTEGQKNIEFPSPTPDTNLVGTFVKVHVTQTLPWSLAGELV